MLFRLIATFVLALGTAGVVIFLNRYVFRRRFPNWVLPAAIAFAVIGFQVFEQYHWYPRKKAALGEQYIIVREFDRPAFWRPWSYIWPSVNKVTVINRNNLQPIEGSNDIYSAVMITISYLQESYYAPFAFDCAKSEFGPYPGDLNEVQWAQMDESLRARICEGG